MIHIIEHIVILAVAFGVMSLIPSIRLRGVGTAIGAALIFILLNFFVGWLVKVVLFLGTFGLAFFVLNYLANVVLLWVTDKLMDKFEAKTFVSLLLGGGVLTLANDLARHLLR